jgi:hypothetical protein
LVAAPPVVSVPAAYYDAVRAELLPGDRVTASAVRVLDNDEFVFREDRFGEAVAQLAAIDPKERGIAKTLLFSSAADVSAHISAVPSDVAWIGFDLEPGMTPAEEISADQYVATVQRFAQTVHASGRRVTWGPVSAAFDGLEGRGQLAAVLAAVDAAVYQGQALFQANGAAAFAAEMTRQRVIVKGHNPRVDFAAQLWVTRQTPAEVVQGFNLARPDLDVVVIGAPASVSSSDILFILAGLSWRK